MSFSGTPLGQGRRLDHSTFLGKPPSNGNRATSPHRIIPTSYAYGAPTLSQRSPGKHISPTRDRTRTSNADLDTEVNDNEPALARFARLKQREAASLATRPGGPKVINSPPKPEKWSVKDTSVNIATAFTQAANEMLPSAPNPNNSWASGSSRPSIAVPRSTSVEYEMEAQSSSSRRLAPPPNKFNKPIGRKPLSKTASVRHVPDSEGEEEGVIANGRGKSPFEHVIDVAKRALAPAAYYMVPRSRSQEPEQSNDHPSLNKNENDREASYDYAAEEQAFQAETQAKRASHIMHKRNRISTDNKAYKPTFSDGEESEYSSDDGKTRRRRRKKKESLGGPLTTLPVISQDKRKKKKSRGTKGNPDAEDEDESDEQTNTDRHSQSALLRTSVPRGSQPPPPIRLSVPRGSIPPESTEYELSMDSAEQGLQSIPEVDEQEIPKDVTAQQRPRSRRSTPAPSSRPFSIGAFLGRIVHLVGRCFMGLGLLFLQLFTTLFFIGGRVLGTIFDVLFNRPARWLSNTNLGITASFAKFAVVGLVGFVSWYALKDFDGSFLPSITFPSTRPPVYIAPDVPAANIAEISMRLQRLENALSGLSVDIERTRATADSEAKSYEEVMGRLGALESQVTVESKRVQEESKTRDILGKSLSGVKQEVEVLQAHILMQDKDKDKVLDGGSDEARALLRALDERVGTVERSVKEALELGKKSTSEPSAGTVPAWWIKLASGIGSKSGITIKSTEGQDVSGLISLFVDKAISLYFKDRIARPDYALQSGGARVIPSLTSPTFEIQPPTLGTQLLGLITSNGYAIGRPPVTALHHEWQNGYCWPFKGSSGQLGVVLSAPMHIEAVTIDHVAPELAFDMRSAPREMEVWGLVEGKDNIEKVANWKEAKRLRKEASNGEFEGGSSDDDPTYPPTLPKHPEYIRVASFTYDIYADREVQTFDVDPEVQALAVDFGITVLRVLNNWGKEEFTCLYRFRVHGRPIEDFPLPYPKDSITS